MQTSSSGQEVCSPTVMRPCMAQPKSTINHSGRLLLQMLTNAPGFVSPRAAPLASSSSRLCLASAIAWRVRANSARPQPISVARW